MNTGETLKKVACYARVSTDRQETDLQILDIEKYISDNTLLLTCKYIDKGISGSKIKRPALDKLLEDAKEGKFEFLIIWRLDRLGRSLSHLIKLVDKLKNYGVKLISIKDQLDFSTPQGELMFHLLGAMAQFERALIRERVISGLEAAKSKGIKLGRDKDPDRNDQLISELREQGLSIRAIAKKLKITPSKVQRSIACIENPKITGVY